MVRKLLNFMQQFKSNAIDQFISHLDISKKNVVAADENNTLNQVIDKLLDAERKVDWALKERDFYKKRVHELEERLAQIKLREEGIKGD